MPREPITVFSRTWNDLELPSGETSRCEWIARLLAASQAAAKAQRAGPAFDPATARVVEVDVDTGDVLVALRHASAATRPVLAGTMIRVGTARRGDHIWAWTLGQEVKHS